MTIKIRRYIATDIPRIHELHLEALRNVPNLKIPDNAIDEDLLDIERNYIHNGGDYLVLEENGEIIGMGALRKKAENIGEIRRMRIDPNHWRKGYGQLILSELENIAKEMGYKKLVLDTSIHQVPAQTLYVKNGYKESGRFQQFGNECILYEKEIA